MPSAALTYWTADRTAGLDDIHAQCAAGLTSPAPNARLADENLRGYVMLLSAHFQGFCRDLHTECIQVVCNAIPASIEMRLMVQLQSLGGRDLDAGNARYEAIREDFERFGVDLRTGLGADPANAARVTMLSHLNLWRNYAAHYKKQPPAHGGPFVLPTVRAWQGACAGLATELDRIVYDKLSILIGAPPW